MIIFLTGASGVGKTTLVETLAKEYSNAGYEFYHFDSVGVPRYEKNPDENWQQRTTHDWIAKLTAKKDNCVAILEGSSDIRFIIEGFKKCNYSDYIILLIDCNEETMIDRLLKDREQPELANDDMKNWLKYLREQAKKLSIDIIDTSDSSRDDSIERIIAKIDSARKISR